jgi:alkanesulfonate monooxygenase SsuD/methylene tetrahydromethanopterin reductase-like flavin-dependent oxidoreductase (luciferase family)
LRFGVSLSPQAATWPELRQSAAEVDRLGYDYLFTWDHLLAPFGSDDQSILESSSLLAALSQHTSRVHLGALVNSNTFRHPALLAKLVVTLDHLSGGRAILGIGAGWYEPEHQDHGIPFGTSVGERLTWLEEAVPIVRALIDGTPPPSVGSHYRVLSSRQAPRPIQTFLRVLVGGWGERRTLPIVASYADIWNAKGTAEELARKSSILDGLCHSIGREPSSIERSLTVRMVIRDDPLEARRVWSAQLAHNDATETDEPDPWLGTVDDLAARWATYMNIGFSTLIVSALAPFDLQTFERLIREVAPTAQRMAGER